MKIIFFRFPFASPHFYCLFYHSNIFTNDNCIYFNFKGFETRAGYIYLSNSKLSLLNKFIFEPFEQFLKIFIHKLEIYAVDQDFSKTNFSRLLKAIKIEPRDTCPPHGCNNQNRMIIFNENNFQRVQSANGMNIIHY